jgi:hypothetical protein
MSQLADARRSPLNTLAIACAGDRPFIAGAAVIVRAAHHTGEITEQLRAISTTVEVW